MLLDDGQVESLRDREAVIGHEKRPCVIAHRAPHMGLERDPFQERRRRSRQRFNAI
ncbi:hypothetical protein WME90_15180 [Sorangium sp. So ce375]|uniref:hypothetical protein n=1 Tax=Sorangium sp. So ce375 TaxID=3133306 RepID=UPI003F5CB58A